MGDHDTKSEPQLSSSFTGFCKILLSTLRFCFLWVTMLHFVLMLVIFTGKPSNARVHIDPGFGTALLICSVFFCLILCIVFLIVDAVMLYDAHMAYRASRGGKYLDSAASVDDEVEKGKGDGEPRKHAASADDIEKGEVGGGQSEMEVGKGVTKSTDGLSESHTLRRDHWFRVLGPSENGGGGSEMEVKTGATKRMDGPAMHCLEGDHLFRVGSSEDGGHSELDVEMKVEKGATKEMDGTAMHCLEGDHLFVAGGLEKR
ncbi:MAG: hypothetical protein LQ350_003543 [Teloschistes chrysophthalmus]|nr:MAG: hypothetical protein LQ350_003543 [Niorma chrysophthalma]